ncbi:MAG: FkbM family methyltransferase, partial [Opitutaceae bacterium]
LGEEAGRVSFTTELDCGNHRIREPSNEGFGTISVDLDSADNVLRAEDPVLIKIDVEGEELRVLKGSGRILQKKSLIAVVMETFRPHNFAQADLIAAEAILSEHGFVPMAYKPWQRELVVLTQPSDGGQNTIYVRGPGEVAQRLNPHFS